jgi:folate-dependent tRNA-U54 methylase TrmFO/GidA
VARRALYHHERLAKLDPDYLSCPAPCGRAHAFRDELCDECPVRDLEQAFFEGCEEVIREQVGRIGWSVRTLYDDVLRIAEMKRPQDALAKVARAIYEQERRRKRAIEEWNREQERRRAR